MFCFLTLITIAKLGIQLNFLLSHSASFPHVIQFFDQLTLAHLYLYSVDNVILYILAGTFCVIKGLLRNKEKRISKENWD